MPAESKSRVGRVAPRKRDFSMLVSVRPGLDELVGSTHPLAELDRAVAEAATGAHVRVGVAPGRRVV